MDTTIHLAALQARYAHVNRSPVFTRLHHGAAAAMVLASVALALTAVFGSAS